MSAEECFNLYKKCVDIESNQFSLEDFKRFQKSTDIKIKKEQNCIAILGLTDHEVEIYFIGVAEDLRGRGLGKKLLKSIIGFSKNYGADFIILEVGINNIAAKNMYLSLNFIEYGIRKNYYRNSSGIREDAIIMKLKIKT
tara:strand:+ start:373 stop:792 length:420 start_codon:yes stop_codon:yes gene_type:complete